MSDAVGWVLTACAVAGGWMWLRHLDRKQHERSAAIQRSHYTQDGDRPEKQLSFEWPGEPIARAPIATSVEFSADPIDDEIAALHRQATDHKGKNWPLAVSLLQKAAALDVEHARWADPAQQVRLPLFLQQAGRFDEAMAEFQRLLDRVPAHVQATFGHGSDLERCATLHSHYHTLYDKMRVACKRQKRMDLVDEYLAEAQVHMDARLALDGQLDAARKAEHAAYEAKEAARVKARAVSSHIF